MKNITSTILLSLVFFTAIASAQITVTGKVFRKDGEKIIPVAGAIIAGEALKMKSADDVFTFVFTEEKVSDENGCFTLQLSLSRGKHAIFARTDDFSMVGFGKTVNEHNVEIELAATASLKARLVHPDTGKPLANVTFQSLGPSAGDEMEEVIRTPYLQSVTTDAEGRFFVKGLVPDKVYYFQSDLPPEYEKRPGDNCLCNFFCAPEAGEFDAGDISFVEENVYNHRQEYMGIFKPFQQEESPTTRFEKAMQQSNESRRPVLILFIHADYNPGFIHWFKNVPFKIHAQKYLAGYEYVPVDVTNPQASELAEKLGVKLPEENAFTIIVCDSDGKQITRRDSANFNAPRFKPDGELLVEFNPVLFLTFLKKFGR